MKNALAAASRRIKGARVLASIAEHGSFRKAAADLEVSVSAISQAVQALETEVGMALLVRTTRSVALTEAGVLFLERAQMSITALDQAFDEARAAINRVSGRLAISAPSVLAHSLMQSVIAPFVARHPDLEMEFVTDDRLLDIVRDGFDGGIRLGEMIDLDMVAIRLTPPFPFIVVGSPTYLLRHGTPLEIDDLREHECIRFRTASGGEIYRWEFELDEKSIAVPVKGRIVVNNSSANLAGAEAGLGLAYCAEPLARSLIRQDRLRPVLTHRAAMSPGLFFYYPRHRHKTPNIKAFAKFARDCLSSSGTSHEWIPDRLAKT